MLQRVGSLPMTTHLSSSEEVTVNLHQESGARAPDLTAPYPRESDLIREARRHPATIAIIREITAEVNAAADKRMELAWSELRDGIDLRTKLFRRVDLVTLGAFTTVNLLLVTLTLALGRLMPLWLAGVLVTTGSFSATMTLIARRSSDRGTWIPAVVRRLAARRFTRRLFANV
jgi:hypothetical protein